jgi:hypothetical protein
LQSATDRDRPLWHMEDVDVSLDDILPLLDSIFCDFRNALRRGISGLDGTARSPTDNHLAVLDVNAEADDNFLEDLFRRYCVAESQVANVRAAHHNQLPLAVLRSGGRRFVALPVNVLFPGIPQQPPISGALLAERSNWLPEQRPEPARCNSEYRANLRSRSDALSTLPAALDGCAFDAARSADSSGQVRWNSKSFTDIARRAISLCSAIKSQHNNATSNVVCCRIGRHTIAAVIDQCAARGKPRLNFLVDFSPSPAGRRRSRDDTGPACVVVSLQAEDHSGSADISGDSHFEFSQIRAVCTCDEAAELLDGDSSTCCHARTFLRLFQEG